MNKYLSHDEYNNLEEEILKNTSLLRSQVERNKWILELAAQYGYVRGQEIRP